MSEVVCGHVEVEGARVHVPFTRVQAIVSKLSNTVRREALATFMATRCDDRFVDALIAGNPELVSGWREHMHYPLSHNGHVSLLLRLQGMGKLPAAVRQELVAAVEEAAVLVPDASFVRDKRLRAVLRKDELESILERIEHELTESPAMYVESWQENGDNDDEKYSMLEEAKECLKLFEECASEYGVDHVGAACRRAIARVDDAIEELGSEPDYEREYEREEWGNRGDARPERSIFDDVDD